MSTKKRDTRRVSRRGINSFRWEALESRTLLAAATETFSGPDLSGLIAAARAGQYSAPAAIDQVVSALESQLTSGPLGDLNSGAVNTSGFVAEVQSLESSYEQYADSELLPEFPNVDELTKEQGQRIVADVISLSQQNAVGLISSSDFATDAAADINSLTSGPIFALNTPVSAFVTTTENFETELNALAQSLSTGASPALTVPQVTSTLLAESNSYIADVYAGLKVPHGNVSEAVASAVANLEVASSNLDQSSTSSAPDRA